MKHDRHQGTAAETTTKKNWHKMQKPEKGEEPACGGKEKTAENTKRQCQKYLLVCVDG